MRRSLDAQMERVAELQKQACSYGAAVATLTPCACVQAEGKPMASSPVSVPRAQSQEQRSSALVASIQESKIAR